MLLQRPCKTLFVASLSVCLLLPSCASLRPRPQLPRVSVCFVQLKHGGIECALQDNKQVFLRWAELQADFLERFDGQILIPRQDLMELLAVKGHGK